MNKERKTLSVDLKGTENWDGTFSPDQEFKLGEKVVIHHHFSTNYTTIYNTASHYDEENDDIEQLIKQPSYSGMLGVTTYCVGLMTVTRIFNRKMWVK